MNLFDPYDADDSVGPESQPNCHAIEAILRGRGLPVPDAGIRSPDNLCWAEDGFVYVQEDKSTTPGALFGAGLLAVGNGVVANRVMSDVFFGPREGEGICPVNGLDVASGGIGGGIGVYCPKGGKGLGRED